MEKKQFLKKININDTKKYSFSNVDIGNCLYKDKDKKFITYNDLYNYDNILNAFDDDGKMVLLLPVRSLTDGHWVCLFIKNNTIHYNDSYGLEPEHFKKWIGKTGVDAFGVQRDVLSELLNKAKQSGFKVKINKTRYQQYKSGTNDCGRHVVCRLILRSLPDGQYNKLLKSTGLSYDDAVCAITKSIIGK